MKKYTFELCILCWMTPFAPLCVPHEEGNILMNFPNTSCSIECFLISSLRTSMKKHLSYEMILPGNMTVDRPLTLENWVTGPKKKKKKLMLMPIKSACVCTCVNKGHVLPCLRPTHYYFSLGNSRGVWFLGVPLCV